MSILLDALKKSEALRQLGNAPNIHTAVETPDAKLQMHQLWIVLPMLILSAIAIAWLGWQQYREPVLLMSEAGVDDLAAPQVAVSPANAVQTKEPNRGRAKSASLWDLNLRATAITTNSDKKSGIKNKQRTRLKKSFNSYKAEKDTADGKATKPSPATATRSSSTPAAPRPLIEEKPDENLAGRSSRLQPHEPEPISFWEVPQSLRDDMPEFKINVLVYSEKPEDRFLLINGLRLKEHKELSDGVVLDEIRPDGAVFRYRNYRFLVKS